MNIDGLTENTVTPGYTPAELPVELPEQPTKSEARVTGIKDSFLTVLFAGLSYASLNVLQWVLDNQANISLGKYEWTKPFLALLIAAVVKGLDRYKYESPDSNRLVKI